MSHTSFVPPGWYIREVFALLAAMAPTREQAIEVGTGKASGRASYIGQATNMD